MRILIGPRTFAHEDQLGLLIAHAEDDLVAPLMQTAAAAIADVFKDAEQGIGAGHRRHDRRGSSGLGQWRHGFGPGAARVKRFDPQVLVILQILPQRFSVHR